MQKLHLQLLLVMTAGHGQPPSHTHPLLPQRWDILMCEHASISDIVLEHASRQFIHILLTGSQQQLSSNDTASPFVLIQSSVRCMHCGPCGERGGSSRIRASALACVEFTCNMHQQMHSHTGCLVAADGVALLQGFQRQSQAAHQLPCLSAAMTLYTVWPDDRPQSSK